MIVSAQLLVHVLLQCERLLRPEYYSQPISILHLPGHSAGVEPIYYLTKAASGICVACSLNLTSFMEETCFLQINDHISLQMISLEFPPCCSFLLALLYRRSTIMILLKKKRDLQCFPGS